MKEYILWKNTPSITHNTNKTKLESTCGRKMDKIKL